MSALRERSEAFFTHARGCETRKLYRATQGRANHVDLGAARLIAPIRSPMYSLSLVCLDRGIARSMCELIQQLGVVAAAIDTTEHDRRRWIPQKSRDCVSGGS
jgi:hypothetical protein